jgi:predicted DNA binding CopG/RHH family protein
LAAANEMTFMQYGTRGSDMTGIARRRQLGVSPFGIELSPLETAVDGEEFWQDDRSSEYQPDEEIPSEPDAAVQSNVEQSPVRSARKRPQIGQMDLVSIRLPADMIDQVKVIAQQRHLPYQTMMRSWIGERLDHERRQAGD